MDKSKIECSICFDKINKKELCMDMKCTHSFHIDCLRAFINSQELTSNIHVCPTCKVPYNAKNLINNETEKQKKELIKRQQLIELKSNTCCSICFDEYSESSIPHELNTCHHFFHKNCIVRWLRECDLNNKTSNCPSCRRNFEEVNIVIRMDIHKKFLELQQIIDPKFQVLVINMQGKYLALEITKETTVKQFSQLCSNKEGIHPEQMRYTFQGKTFSIQNGGDKKLIDYGIYQSSTINMLLRLFGGNQSQ